MANQRQHALHLQAGPQYSLFVSNYAQSLLDLSNGK